MIHAEFDDLQPGDKVLFGSSETVYTVLGKKFEPYTAALENIGEEMVSLSPDDDNYVRKVGMFDSEVPFMRRLREGE